MPLFKSQGFYEVIVGNIGKVYEGTQYKSALRTYGTYVRASKKGHGRAAGEGVTLWKDGDIVKEYSGKLFNPNILSKLRKGIRGFVKIQNGRLIIKT